jgi:hypothetical protein
MTPNAVLLLQVGAREAGVWNLEPTPSSRHSAARVASASCSMSACSSEKIRGNENAL